MWRTWDTTSGSWRTLTGGELLVARGLGDVRQRISI
jgi:beta-glucosidase